jgi:simple sugar transport system substrate-binding protein
LLDNVAAALIGFSRTQADLNKNDIKTIQDLDAKLPGFGHSDQATAPWLPSTQTQ